MSEVWGVVFFSASVKSLRNLEQTPVKIQKNNIADSFMCFPRWRHTKNYSHQNSINIAVNLFRTRVSSNESNEKDQSPP